MLLKKTGGHRFFLNVNVTCVDLVSCILIFHFVAQASNKFMGCCRRVDAVVGCSWLASITVSSAKVPVDILSVVGKSDVYNR
jgi:Na+/pantothenate symporter